MNCERQPDCLKYQHDKRTPIKDNHMRANYKCVHFKKGECEIWEEVEEAEKLLKVQQGQACQLKKRNRILNEKR